MHIINTKNHGISYLEVVENYSTYNDIGERLDKKRLVMSLGPLHRFDDGRPDYIKRLRQSFKDGEPIIDELKPLVGQIQPFDLRKIYGEEMNSSSNLVKIKNLGYLLLDAYYDSLGIYDVLNLQKSRSKIEYDLNGIAKLLIFGRILFPDSKLGTFEQRDKFFFKITDAKDMNEIYRTLDVLNEKSVTIQSRTNLKIAKSIVGRETSICFYDVTNYWFEVPYNDPDIYDENNNLVEPGFRKKGASKENRKDPIVQMGLFIDRNGIPISYHLFPGNTNDQVTLEPALLETFDKMNYGRVIVVADGGLNSSANIASLVNRDRGHGYIFPRSVRKSNQTTKDWLLDETGYLWNSDMTVKTKSMVVTRTIEDRNGNKNEVEEKVVGYWSKKFYDKEVHQHEKTLKFLKEAVENPSSVVKLSGTKERFLIELNVKATTGEIINDSVKHYELDIVKLEEYEKLFGYNIIFTSETKLTDSDILQKYHGLSRIEDSFRVTKSDLEGRPVFVRTKEHINAHFLICFCALQMIRLIQYRILKFLGKDTLNTDGWEAGLSADRIKQALNEWACCVSGKDNDKFNFLENTADLLLIKSAYGVDYGFTVVSTRSIREIKRDIDRNVMKSETKPCKE